MVESSRPTRWKPQARSQGKAAFSGAGMPWDDELTRLRRELVRVNKERFLREAATSFAKESS